MKSSFVSQLLFTAKLQLINNFCNVLGFHHNNWGDEPPMSQYKYSDLKSWQLYFKGDPLEITENQQKEVVRKMKALAHRVFIEKKRFGTQWFQFAF
jgi:hypothetical protein